MNTWWLRSCLFAAQTAIAGCAAAQFNGSDQFLCAGCPFPLIADMDQDGDPDLVFTRPSDPAVTWMRNPGNGQFLPDTFLAANPYHLNIQLIGDVDGDGGDWLDLVGVSSWGYEDSVVAILRNDGSGFVAEIIDHPMATTSVARRNLDQLVDLDGDGDLDMLAIPGFGSAAWYRNMGGGSYQREHISYWCLPAGGNELIPLDIDEDGDLDLVTYSVWYFGLVTFWNIGNANFSPFTRISPPIGYNGGRAGAADVNGDGYDDFVVGGLLCLRSGDGTFTTDGGLAGGWSYQSIANIDCDPLLEAVLSDDQTLLGIAIKDLTTEEGALELSVTTPPTFLRTVIADLDGDERSDLVIGWVFGDSITWRSNNFTPPAVSLDIPIDVLHADTVLPLLSDWAVPDYGGYFTGPGVYDDTLHTALIGIEPPATIEITYHFADWVTYNNCEGSATDDITLAFGTGLDERRETGIMVFPNPAMDEVHLAWPWQGPAVLTITDMLGREVRTRSLHTWPASSFVTISTRELEPGSYLATVQGDHAQRLSAVLVVHR